MNMYHLNLNRRSLEYLIGARDMLEVIYRNPTITGAEMQQLRGNLEINIDDVLKEMNMTESRRIQISQTKLDDPWEIS